MKSLRLSMCFASIGLAFGCSDTSDIQQIDPNEAKAALLQIATLQERFFLDNDEYTDDILQLGFSTDPAFSVSGLFAIDLELMENGFEYSATATYIGADSSSQVCRVLSINSRGEKNSEPDPNCWAR